MYITISQFKLMISKWWVSDELNEGVTLTKIIGKLEKNSPILTKIFSVWENWGKYSVFLSWFSHDFCQCRDPSSVENKGNVWYVSSGSLWVTGI